MKAPGRTLITASAPVTSPSTRDTSTSPLPRWTRMTTASSLSWKRSPGTTASPTCWPFWRPRPTLPRSRTPSTTARPPTVSKTARSRARPTPSASQWAPPWATNLKAASPRAAAALRWPSSALTTGPPPSPPLRRGGWNSETTPAITRWWSTAARLSPTDMWIRTARSCWWSRSVGRPPT